eukprot:TRINITY_DN2017_c0_g1_i22.p1 TRINITY_DN2017_c0_g1~~TRINITY_DN2017_c0_g1_i22.p1  ORF type:complete len:114 (-),score=17.09 TRINITY_DN2017_c0_g1_i22:134-475(-)
MHLELLKKESIGDHMETEKVSQLEIMDGSPMQGESIPLRVYLGPFQGLTPTYKDTSTKFQVRYYVNLAIVDFDERRYFKEVEIFLWRACPSPFYFVEKVNEQSHYTFTSHMIS